MLTLRKYYPSFLLIALSAIMAILFLSSTAFAGKKIHSELLEVADVKKSGDYVRTRFLEIMKKPFTSDASKKALIIGDSHAQDLYNAVLESGNLQNYQLSTRYIPARCQIYLGEKLDQFIKAKDKALCKKSDNLVQAQAQIKQADVVILVSNWQEWSAKALPQTIENLKLSPTQKLFVVGRKSFGKIRIRNYLRMSEEELGALRNKVESEHRLVNDIMKKTLSTDIFINLHDLVCGLSSDCPVFTSEKRLISFDGGHLTKDGAKYIGNILFKNSKLAGL